MITTCRPHRSNFLLAAGASSLSFAIATQAQVDVGNASVMRQLIPAEKLEASAVQQYGQMLADAKSKGTLAPDSNAQVQRLRAIAARLVPQAGHGRRLQLHRAAIGFGRDHGHTH